MKISDSTTKNEIDLALSGHWNVVQNVEVLSKIPSSDHRMVRCKLRLYLRRKRMKLKKTKTSRMETGRARSQELQIPLQNKFSLLNEQN